MPKGRQARKNTARSRKQEPRRVRPIPDVRAFFPPFALPNTARWQLRTGWTWVSGLPAFLMGALSDGLLAKRNNLRMTMTWVALQATTDDDKIIRIAGRCGARSPRRSARPWPRSTRRSTAGRTKISYLSRRSQRTILRLEIWTHPAPAERRGLVPGSALRSADRGRRREQRYSDDARAYTDHQSPKEQKLTQHLSVWCGRFDREASIVPRPFQSTYSGDIRRSR